jgi:hypothetical protein
MFIDGLDIYITDEDLRILDELEEQNDETSTAATGDR